MEDQDADYKIQNEINSIMIDGFHDRAGFCDKSSRGLTSIPEGILASMDAVKYYDEVTHIDCQLRW